MDRPLCIGCRRTLGGALVKQGRGLIKPEDAVCIRDGEEIGFDLSKPYCGKCFRSWSRWKNREYSEEYCHICGLNGPSTMDSPICVRCYLNVQHLAFTQALGDDYVPWVDYATLVSLEQDDDAMPW